VIDPGQEPERMRLDDEARGRSFLPFVAKPARKASFTNGFRGSFLSAMRWRILRHVRLGWSEWSS